VDKTMDKNFINSNNAKWRAEDKYFSTVKGVYIVTINTGDKIATQKLVIE